MNTKYAAQIIHKLQETLIDAVLIPPSNDLQMLLGFSPFICERFQGLFFQANGHHFYVCNRLSADEIQPYLQDIPLYIWTDCERYTTVVKDILAEYQLSNKKIGALYQTPGSWITELSELCPITWVPFYQHMNETRIIKSNKELDALRQASHITDLAWQDALSYIQPGRSVSEIVNFINSRMIHYGGTAPACNAYEKKAAGYPHYVMPKLSHIMESTDSLLVDFGCAVKGYRSDCTRTVFLGKVSGQERELYSLVLSANLTAEALLAEGIPCCSIDAAARDVIKKGGCNDFFITRLGHGIGINGHEAPDISAVNQKKLMRGMAFTIEPGIYIPGMIGIRIEDVCIINQYGLPEVLNKTTKELTILS